MRDSGSVLRPQTQEASIRWLVGPVIHESFPLKFLLQKGVCGTGLSFLPLSTCLLFPWWELVHGGVMQGWPRSIP